MVTSPEEKGQEGSVDPIDMIGSDLDSMEGGIGSGESVYFGWSKVSEKSRHTVSTNDESPVVYGVGFTPRKPRSHKKEPERKRPSRLLISIGVVAALGLGLIGWRAFAGGIAADDGLRTEKVQKKVADSKDAQPQQAQTQEKPKPAEPKKAPALTAANIGDIVANRLSYNGEDVTIDNDRFKVDERNGYVMVFQDLEASVTYDPKDLVATTSKRILALAYELTGKRIGEGEGDEFKDATLVVRSSTGKVYLAICEGPGEVRTSDDPMGLIKEARAYTLSRGLLASIGDKDLVTNAGEGLTDLNGTPILADGAVSTGNATSNRAPAPVYVAQDDGGDGGDDGSEGDGGDGGAEEAPQDNGGLPEDNGGNAGGDNGGNAGDNGGDNGGNADAGAGGDGGNAGDNGGTGGDAGNGGNNGGE